MRSGSSGWPRRLRGLLPFVAAAVLLAASPAPPAAEGPGDYLGFRGIVVPPVGKTDVAGLVDGGAFDCDGYSYLVVNLAGEMKDRLQAPGLVGAYLIPDVLPYNKVFENLLLLPVPLEIAANVTEAQYPYFMAKQTRFEVGFPRYRLLLYNTTGTAATVVVSVYRSK